MARNKNIVCIPFPDIPNAYVVISGHEDKEKGANGCKKCMSFFYDGGEIGAEWEPDYGPITKIIKLKEGDEGAIPHWFYDYYAGQGHWSQLAVEETGIASYFIRGYYQDVFRVLKEWAT